MRTKTEIQMTFLCNQSWDAMQPTKNGRFCDGCKKEVIDFRNLTQKEFTQHIGQSTTLCGYFKAEQVNMDLIKQIEAPKQLKYFAFLSVFTFLLSAKTTFSQIKSITNTEQTTDSTKKIPDKNELTYDPTAPKNITCSKPEHTILVTHKRTFYWSRRFPFIHVRRNGRHAMGNMNVRFI